MGYNIPILEITAYQHYFVYWLSILIYYFINSISSKLADNMKLTIHFLSLDIILRLPRWLSGKESACQCIRHRRHRLHPWVGKIPWGREWEPTLVFLPTKSHGQRSLYSMGSQRVGHNWACRVWRGIYLTSLSLWFVSLNIFYSHKTWAYYEKIVSMWIISFLTSI